MVEVPVADGLRAMPVTWKVDALMVPAEPVRVGLNTRTCLRWNLMASVDTTVKLVAGLEPVTATTCARLPAPSPQNACPPRIIFMYDMISLVSFWRRRRNAPMSLRAARIDWASMVSTPYRVFRVVMTQLSNVELLGLACAIGGGVATEVGIP